MYLARKAITDSLTISTATPTRIVFRNAGVGSDPDLFDTFGVIKIDRCGWVRVEACVELVGNIADGHLLIQSGEEVYVGFPQYYAHGDTTIFRVSGSFYRHIGDGIVVELTQFSGNDVSMTDSGASNYIAVS